MWRCITWNRQISSLMWQRIWEISCMVHLFYLGIRRKFSLIVDYTINTNADDLYQVDVSAPTCIRMWWGVCHHYVRILSIKMQRPWQHHKKKKWNCTGILSINMPRPCQHHSKNQWNCMGILSTNMLLKTMPTSQKEAMELYGWLHSLID